MIRIPSTFSGPTTALHRREWLRLGALSLFGGMTLPKLLQAREATLSAPTGSAKSVILLNLFGGPSHVDTFDMKPAAPAEVRGEFQPIATTIPGLSICEHLPEFARRMHVGTLIRTVSHGYNSHNPYGVLTGFTGGNDRDNYFAKRSDHPSIASVCQFAGIRPTDVPPYVLMPAHPGFSQGLRRAGPYGGYLGSQFDPTITTCDPTFARKGAFYDPVQPFGESELPSLELLPELSAGRLGERRTLLQQVDAGLARLADSPATDQMSHVQRQAFRLITSGATRRAFDLSAESDRVRDRYGRTLFGSSLLIGRRLVEAGTTFVTVNWECAAETHGGHWDMHQNNFGMLRSHLPVLDQIVSALLDDLTERGMLETTLVIVMGEMGRTPKVNRHAGRDHWPTCGFSFLAGGGVRAGVVHGASDRRAAYPLRDPVSPGDLVATFYQLLGINPHMVVPNLAGQPIEISHGGAPWMRLSPDGFTRADCANGHRSQPR